MVDLTSFAVIRSLADPDHLGMGAPVEALVDVGARVTNIVIHQGGVPRFVRILLMGGQDVTDAVAERMGVPQAQAEAMKQQLGIGVAAEGMDAQAAGRVVEAVGSSFVDEIRGSLDYYLASSGSSPISRLVLTGGGARLGGLAQRLGVMTRVPVEIGTPMHSLQVGQTGLSPEQIAFVEPLAAVPVGLALGAAS
jgi:type IV pilus assembly protein PilM